MPLSVQFTDTKLKFIKINYEKKIIATVGLRTIILLDFSLNLLTRYLDSNKSENFNCCEYFDLKNKENIYQGDDFSENNDENKILLCVAGEMGIIKIIDLMTGELIGFLKGHTGSIYSLKAFNHYLISCSLDSTIRIWDIYSKKCAIVLGGVLGHRDKIQSIDIHHSFNRIISGGIDFTIKEWEIGPSIKEFEKTGLEQMIGIPLHSFDGILKAPISELKYYGDLIIILSNDIISVIYDKINDYKYDNMNIDFDKLGFIYLGKVNMYDSCRTFKIIKHLLIGLGLGGELYLFNLPDIFEDNTPFIVESNLKNCKGFEIYKNTIFLLSNDQIKAINIDLTRFNENYD